MKKITFLTFLSAFLFYNTTKAQTTDDLIFTIKTDNPGTSNSTSIDISSHGVGNATYIDWNNDGDITDPGEGQIFNGSQLNHDYGVAGTYQIRIIGDFSGFNWGAQGYNPNDPTAVVNDRQKMLSIDQWGTDKATRYVSAFVGCLNLVINALDTPQFPTDTSVFAHDSLGSMFTGCQNLGNGTGNVRV